MDERLGVQLGDVLALEAPVRAVVEALDPDAVFVFDAPAMFAAFDVLVRLGESGKMLMARRMEGSGMHPAARRLSLGGGADGGGVGLVGVGGAHDVGDVEAIGGAPGDG